MSRYWRGVFFLLPLLLVPAALLGQGGRSTILGTVLDQSDAAVPHVSVTVLNTGTQQKRTVTTNDRGDFEISALDIGNYEVTAEAAGFRKAVVKDVHLEVDQRARVDIKLQLGEVTQQVQVQAEVASVQTDDSTLSTVIAHNEIRELPLPANRNLFRLALRHRQTTICSTCSTRAPGSLCPAGERGDRSCNGVELSSDQQQLGAMARSRSLPADW